MKVKETSKNINQRIFYKDAYLRSGRTILYSAWRETGEQVYINQPADNEIPNSGMYYYDFTTPNIDCYVLIIATDGQDAQGSVLKVGSPQNFAFYLRGDLAENLTINFEIYDQSSNVLSSGTMENVSSGFYKTSVQGLAEPWFLEVNELVEG
jgi:hypothetical protein